MIVMMMVMIKTVMIVVMMTKMITLMLMDTLSICHLKILYERPMLLFGKVL